LLAKKPNAPLGIWFYALSFTTFASKLAPTRGLPAKGFLPAIPLSASRTVRNVIYFVQRYIARGFQPSANKLSTPPPTANGDKCGFTQNFLHRNRRKSVTYPEARFPTAIVHFLIGSLKASVCVAYRGWRTPYPQKRQQTLGATSTNLWKTAESRDKSGFPRVLTAQTSDLIVF
jgi:hypothetical protein